jgi:hypothetical protein
MTMESITYLGAEYHCRNLIVRPAARQRTKRSELYGVRLQDGTGGRPSFMKCVCEHIPQSQKNLLGKDFIGNPPSSACT